MLTMYQCYDIFNERFTTVFLIMLTAYLTIHQMKTNCFLTAVDKIVYFNYPVLLNDYGYLQVCCTLKNAYILLGNTCMIVSAYIKSKHRTYVNNSLIFISR